MKSDIESNSRNLLEELKKGGGKLPKILIEKFGGVRQPGNFDTTLQDVYSLIFSTDQYNTWNLLNIVDNDQVIQQVLLKIDEIMGLTLVKQQKERREKIGELITLLRTQTKHKTR